MKDFALLLRQNTTQWKWALAQSLYRECQLVIKAKDRKLFILQNWQF